MRTKLIGEGQRADTWRNRARDPAFTAMLVAQCLIIFAIPFAAVGYEEVREVVALLFFIFTFLVCLISPGRVATTLAILAFISGLAGYALERMEPSTTIALILVFIGAVSAFVVATYALGYATLAPGRVTFHRVLGAIALYLNIGLMFGAIYRMIWYFIPSSLTNIPGDAGCGLWPDTLFQLCHPYIDRLWRHRAGPSRYPHARQCRGHHRPIVSGDPARSPDHAGASRGAAALLTKTPARPRDFERWIDGRRPRSGWKSREQGA